MSEITFVRHGETTANASGVWQGHGDAGLSCLGRSQVAAVGARLSGHRFDLVVASDLERAVATAEAAGFHPAADSGLREMDVGRWEGLTREEVVARFPDEVGALVRGEDVPIGGGETWGEFCHRVDTAVGAVEARLGEEGRALVITHGGVVHAVISGLLGFRVRGRPWPVEHVRNTAITVVAVEGGRRRVRAFNDATHVQAAPPLDPHSALVALVRHGESVANLEQRWHGLSDGALTPRGRLQGAQLAAWYDSADHVYTSHLQRARLTAEAFAAACGLPVTVRDDLYEMAFGAWEDLTTEEIRGRFPEEWAATYECLVDLPRGGAGETMAGAAARMQGAVGEIAAAHPGGRVAVVTHGGAIRAWVGSVVGLDHGTREALEPPGNASVSHLRVGLLGVVLVDYNLGVV